MLVEAANDIMVSVIRYRTRHRPIRVTWWKITVWCHVMSCYVMLCYVMLCHVMSCHVMSCHVMSCHIMSCHVISCHVMCVSGDVRYPPQRYDNFCSSKRELRLKLQHLRVSWEEKWDARIDVEAGILSFYYLSLMLWLHSKYYFCMAVSSKESLVD